LSRIIVGKVVGDNDQLDDIRMAYIEKAIRTDNYLQITPVDIALLYEAVLEYKKVQKEFELHPFTSYNNGSK
jgi:hypothetical protein